MHSVVNTFFIALIGTVFSVYVSGCTPSASSLMAEVEKDDVILADPILDVNDFNDTTFDSCFQGNASLRRSCEKKRKELAPLFAERISGLRGDDVRVWKYIYISAALGYKDTVPAIRKLLIETSRIYGWEGPRYDRVDDFLNDQQYPWQIMCIHAIESIEGKPLRLGKREYDYLYGLYSEDLPLKIKQYTDPAHVQSSLFAYWLLHRLGYRLPLYRK